ncbi:PPM-type phosphatase domain-containing protein [Mycena indigotica]|uniref:Protein PNS1 n=1 Tax=Mycena indigotica TaxID=2126181 RepID=A0A8H6TFD6_9AGAR|nr:PPM-type phosphatase domain-containing protein [Mycena indigotica]KAF7315742.1 PPM-type phosphatase domain-containing protein [Mycena indigotica]
MPFSDSPNARSKSITTAELDTYGVLNRHSTKNSAYQVGISEDKGSRRTMEDAHSFVVDFANVRGQGFFAVFDGHAGKHAAEWCGNNFHSYLLSCMKKLHALPIPDVLNQTFHDVDESLSRMCEESQGKIHSGCTAVTAFLRIEDEHGQQPFLPPSSENDDLASMSSNESTGSPSGDESAGKKKKKRQSLTGSRIRKAFKSLASGPSSPKNSTSPTPKTPRSQSPTSSMKGSAEGINVVIPPSATRRVLYCANAGDARGVLCRGGIAVRLTYDHKGSDKQEAKRIIDAGGFVMSGRVNGVLAVTRSLGDSSMKDFVVGAPYTTETELCDEDDFLILACDGLWDVTSDQAAVDLIHNVTDAQVASQLLLKHAMDNHTTDNVTVLVVSCIVLDLYLIWLTPGDNRRNDIVHRQIDLLSVFSSTTSMSWGQQQPPPPQWQQQQQYQQGYEFQGMGPTQQYAEQYAPPSQPFFNNDSKGEYERFKPKKRIQDPIFLILFILQFLGFVGVSVLVLKDWSTLSQDGGGLGKGNSGTHISLNQSTVYLLLLVTAAALLLSSAYLMLVRAFTKVIMHITLILSILLNIGIAVYYWLTKYYSGAIIFTIIALFSVLSYWGFKSRIPLAALLLQIVMDVAKHHISVYVVAFASLFIQAALAVWFTFTSIAIYSKYTPGNPSCANGTSCSSGKVAGLIFYSVFSFLWTSQVVGNVALATLAGGPFGCWYYFGPRGSDGGAMPKNPTLSALGRASTLSLGSIAFGSLIVTLLELLRMLLRAAENSANADGHPVEACLACCAACFVGMIESLVEYFNRYAYIEIALYGKPYIEAAKDTWRLLVDRGVSAIVNDSLVNMTLTWGAYAVGLLSSLFSYLYLRFTHPAYNANGDYTAPVLLFAFLIGMQCSITLSSAIEAGVSTIFVGLGEDPQVLAVRAPALFGLIASTYPDVVRGV